MESKNVLVTIISNHEGETNEQIECSYPGFCTISDNAYKISYKEALDDGTTLTDCTIEFDDENLTIIKGPQHLGSVLKFKAGENLATMYHTPYGVIDVNTVTKKLKILTSEKHVLIKLEYDIHLNSQFSSKCSMSIKIVTTD